MKPQKRYVGRVGRPHRGAHLEKQEVVARIRDDYLQGFPVGVSVSEQKYGYDRKTIARWLKELDPDLYKALGDRGEWWRKLSKQEVEERISKILVSLLENPYKTKPRLAKETKLGESVLTRLFRTKRNYLVPNFRERLKLYHLFMKMFSSNAEFHSVSKYAKAMGISAHAVYSLSKKLREINGVLENIKKDAKARTNISKRYEVNPEWWLDPGNKEMAMIRLIWHY